MTPSHDEIEDLKDQIFALSGDASRIACSS
jgi:hypothetical protein